MRPTLTPVPARQAAEHDRLVADLNSLLADLATLRDTRIPRPTACSSSWRGD